MGKAENTKGFILNKSRKVFCEKGYAKENRVIKIKSCLTISRHITYTAEGLKMTRSVFNLSSEEANNQVSYIKSLLYTSYN